MMVKDFVCTHCLYVCNLLLLHTILFIWNDQISVTWESGVSTVEEKLRVTVCYSQTTKLWNFSLKIQLLFSFLYIPPPKKKKKVSFVFCKLLHLKIVTLVPHAPSWQSSELLFFFKGTFCWWSVYFRLCKIMFLLNLNDGAFWKVASVSTLDESRVKLLNCFNSQRSVWSHVSVQSERYYKRRCIQTHTRSLECGWMWVMYFHCIE